MKFWISKNKDVSLREQITRQIVLGIISGDLKPNQKLPSMREMSLRYAIHYNTVHTAYNWLQERGWIEARAGSGVFVKEKLPQELVKSFLTTQVDLDTSIADFVGSLRARGFTSNQILERMQAFLSRDKADSILVIENDAELRKILIKEIQQITELPIYETNITDIVEKSNTVVTALEKTADKLPNNLAKVVLRLNSVQNALRGKERPAKTDLVGIASRWETFSSWSQTILLAAGIEARQLIVRDAKEKAWKRGLSSCAFVITDALTAGEIKNTCTVRVFHLITADSLCELQNLIN
jgi:DNA-binding transcriptional regulator YhcF (GntR family)